MSEFGRIRRNFWRHKKAKKAGLEAIGLWTVANAWTRDNRRAGFVPYSVVVDIFEAGALANDLVRARLWIPVPGGYMFHDWFEHNEDDYPEGAAGELVNNVIPNHPRATRTAMERQVTSLMDEGTDRRTLELALQKWLEKPNAGPALLPHLVSDVMRERAEDDLELMLREALVSGDVSKLARRGIIYTPEDDEPPGLDVAGVRAWNAAKRKAWVELKLKELVK